MGLLVSNSMFNFLIGVLGMFFAMVVLIFSLAHVFEHLIFSGGDFWEACGTLGTVVYPAEMHYQGQLEGDIYL